MGLEVISGEDFYTTVVDMGEEIEFLTNPTIKQYASITSYRATGTTNLTDGVYQYRGVMTFDSVDQQNELIGEYFTRQTNKRAVHILTGVLPENTTYKIGSVYAIECNEKIDIISHFEDGAEDEFGEVEQIPVYLAKNVDCYITVTNRPLVSGVAGYFVETITNLTLPAKYQLTTDSIVVKKGFVFDDETKETKYTDIRYQVESIDASLMDVIEKEVEEEVEIEPDPENPDAPTTETQLVKKTFFVGILRCTITEDKR